MANAGDHPEPCDDRGIAPDICAMLKSEPGVGFSILDADGVIRFANARAGELFLQTTPDQIIGRSLEDLYEQEWAAERREVLNRIAETGKPAIMRHIRFGRQLQSTIRLLPAAGEERHAFLVTTVEGEHEPEHAEEFDIVESAVIHLGPLDPLTRREIEILAFIGHGMSTKQIADTLHRSPRTIERHCDGLREKLRTTNRIQLAEFARRAGLRVEDANLKRV